MGIVGVAAIMLVLAGCGLSDKASDRVFIMLTKGPLPDNQASGPTDVIPGVTYGDAGIFGCEGLAPGTVRLSF